MFQILPLISSRVVMGTMAFFLTIGVGAAEFGCALSRPDILTANKLTREMQGFAFRGFGGKLGIDKSFHKTTILASEDEITLDLSGAGPQKSGIKEICLLHDEMEQESIYDGDVVEVRINEGITPGARFQAEVVVKNTGNVDWYGVYSGCEEIPTVSMGTFKELDRASRFYQSHSGSGWLGENRVAMIEERVQPGEEATFAFTSVAPSEEGIYREFFSLVMEDVVWMDTIDIAVDVRVGEITEEDEYRLQFIRDVSVGTRELEGEQFIYVERGDQKMSIYWGDHRLYTMTVSTGAWDTPTPVGYFRIRNQTELLKGSEAPYYRMPYWQGFTEWGHGLHALPYLGEPGGYYWEEALDHIGVPVSHGCIRMLPDDAVLMYEWGRVGMLIQIVP